VIIALYVGFEPIRVLEHEELRHKEPALTPQVALLAESSEIPPLTVRLVAIKVMNGEGVAGRGVVRVPAPLAAATGFLLDLLRYFRPVRRVLTA